jgi:hypothetical protein
MDATKWNETLPCPKCVSDDTDIGWTSRDAIKVTEKIYNDISPGILHDKDTVSTVLRRPLHYLDCGATYEETWIRKSVELDEDEEQVGG